MGRLYYEVWATSAEARYNLAEHEDRRLTASHLGPPPPEQAGFGEVLEFQYSTRKPNYLYHHYNENCVRGSRYHQQRAGRVVSSESWAQSIPSRVHIRQHMMRHTSFSPFVDWVLNFLQSGWIDTPYQPLGGDVLPAVHGTGL